MDELRLLVLGIGVLIIALIYLWGMRSRIRARLQERRHRLHRPEDEPVLEMNGSLTDSPDRVPEDIPEMSPNDPRAKYRLVDVVVTPRSPEAPPAAPMKEPVAPEPNSVEPVASDPVVTPLRREPSRGPTAPPTDVSPRKTVALIVASPRGQKMRGDSILAATRELDLKYNPKQGVFECLPDSEAEPDPERDPVFSMAHLKEPGTFDLERMGELETPGVLLFMRLPGPVEAVSSLELMVSSAGQLSEKLHGIICDERRNKLTNQSLSHLRSEVAEFERRLRLRKR